MTEIAETQIQRLISLVAWMSQRDTGEPMTYSAAAEGLGVTEKVLQQDLQVLIDLTDSYRSWLGSLRVSLVDGGFTVGSRGAFQRPLRLAHDELAALTVGLAGLRGGKLVAERLGSARPDAPSVERNSRIWAVGHTPDSEQAGALDLLRSARDTRHKVELVYCGADGEPSQRVVHPYQILQAGKAWYLIAWCEKAGAMRHFRVERILALDESDELFEPRKGVRRIARAEDLVPKQAAAGATVVSVAFSPRIARWLREEHPGGEDQPDGRYLVRFSVSNPAWLIREVLQYGVEAELIAPEGMREMMRRWLG